MEEPSAGAAATGFLFQWENHASPAEPNLPDLLQVCTPDIHADPNTRATSFTAPSKTEQDQTHRQFHVPL